MLFGVPKKRQKTQFQSSLGESNADVGTLLACATREPTACASVASFRELAIWSNSDALDAFWVTPDSSGHAAASQPDG